MLWRFDNHQEFLNTNLLPQIIDLDKVNYRAQTSAQARSCTNCSILRTRTNRRKYLKLCIGTTPPRDDNDYHQTIIIKIDGDGALTHPVVEEYM